MCVDTLRESPKQLRYISQIRESTQHLGQYVLPIIRGNSDMLQKVHE